MADWAQALTPAGTAILGMSVGLSAPFISAALARRTRRREDERSRCDRILALFEDGDVSERLLAPDGRVRRTLMLIALCVEDDRARDACTELARYAATANASAQETLDRWATMAQEVSRARRLAS